MNARAPVAGGYQNVWGRHYGSRLDLDQGPSRRWHTATIMSIQRQTIQRILSDPHRCQDVVAHRLIFCEVALASPPDERILECECCRRFLA